ncbi:MAG: diaminopimelate epimerase [Desulfamplus sp.]|nr:diaminopimelate epimerase [Desulfamplus sp.]
MGEPVLDPVKIPFVVPLEQLAAIDLVTEPVHVNESTQVKEPNQIKESTLINVAENASDRKKQAVDIPINVDGKTFNITAVSMGNPHAVIFVDDVSAAPVETCGKEIEKHPAFPEKANVEFIQIIDRKQMSMRVWERGAGETLACGTGASAALVAACLNGKSEREATVHLNGGDLKIEWRESDNHIYKTGPARSVFKGSIDL